MFLFLYILQPLILSDLENIWQYTNYHLVFRINNIFQCFKKNDFPKHG